MLNGPRAAEPPVARGTVVRVGKSGRRWKIRFRDRETIEQQVPPCRRVRCTTIDCGMDGRHGWRKICAVKELRRYHDIRYALDFGALPTPPAVGDFIRFYLASDGHHAVLESAAHHENGAPYFQLGQ